MAILSVAERQTRQNRQEFRWLKGVMLAFFAGRARLNSAVRPVPYSGSEAASIDKKRLLQWCRARAQTVDKGGLGGY